MNSEVQRLLAIEEIRLLKPRYCRFLDAKDWGSLRSLFTDDARFQYRPQTGVWEGLEALDRIAGVLHDNVTVHHVHAPEITFNSDTEAETIWAMEDWVFRAPEQRDLPSVHGQGHYHETCVCVDGVWKISRLVLTRLRMAYTMTPPTYP